MAKWSNEVQAQTELPFLLTEKCMIKLLKIIYATNIFVYFTILTNIIIKILCALLQQ